MNHSPSPTRSDRRGDVHFRGNIQWESGRFTDPGPKAENQDFLGMRAAEGSLMATKGMAACIADGVSAASAAREAAETTVRSFLTDYFETPESWQVKTSAQRVLTSINRWLFSQGQQHSSSEKGCVTTFTALILKSRTGHFFHIGDSRLYRLREGNLELLTRDHTTQLSPGTCYLSRAMGVTLNPQIDYDSFPLAPGDLFALTTDGIHQFISHGELRRILSLPASPQEIADLLGQSTSLSDDNRSVLVLRVHTLPDEDTDDVYRHLAELPFPPALLPGQQIDGLRIEKLLSESPRSQIYQVTDTLDQNRQLVLKTPSPLYEDDPAYLERFALEEWIGLRVDHPHLVKAVRRSTPKTFLYHLVEWIEGPTLAVWSNQHPRPPIHQILEWTQQLVSGVRALHRKETLHQDLKPDNLVIDSSGILKIIDYGSCRIAGMSEIASPFDREIALGTLDFSAPEFRLGAAATTRSDLFSIAVITYHLLTGGKHPYGEAWQRARTLQDFHRLRYQSATQHHPMVPLWMDATLKRALSIQPEHRHESMSEFVTYLQRPDPEQLPLSALPLAQRRPLLFWKLLSLLLFIAWITTWMWASSRF
ncbi:serine/threonine protein phosphatase PrpC [Haloferula luteola]|uniref:Serine/threonine protein phosphatase PrpC n=1 Tax=Haloferula luteola TaxID=595692 RepID=A0A840UYA9_9BACT|nr:bifunctional protein-serine/threonine kinase/phosphatase [Haloferula luteola]MBB5350725.1 serine/threonine protein phosphatase PrpC [Haloferula luteola]